MRHISDVLESCARPSSAPAARTPHPDALTAAECLKVGDQYLRAGRLQEAARYLIAGVRRHPTAYGWTRLGQMWREDGMLDHAQRAFGTALELDPDNAYATVGLAHAVAENESSSPRCLCEQFIRLSEVIARPQHGDVNPALNVAVKILTALARKTDWPGIIAQRDALRALRAAPTSELADSAIVQLNAARRFLAAHIEFETAIS